MMYDNITRENFNVNGIQIYNFSLECDAQSMTKSNGPPSIVNNNNFFN